MALEETSAPKSGHNLKGTLQEIADDGKDDQWYLVASYPVVATARTTAYTLRGQFPNLDIRADEGSVLARKRS